MADVEMSYEDFAGSLARGRKRERQRAAAVVRMLAAQYPAAADVLEEAAERIEADDAPAPTGPVEDELPPVRHGDDFSDGVALIAAHSRMGGAGGFRD